MDHHVRILDFDSSVTVQSELMERFNPQVVDMRDLGGKARYWASPDTACRIIDRLETDARGAFTFTGSGDFHHVSCLLVRQFSEPLTLFVFASHPDWDILPPRLGCGSWLSSLLLRGPVQKAVILGVSSDDISGGWIQAGDFRLLSGGRLELYPYSHPPSRVFLRHVPCNPSFELTGGFPSRRIRWRGIGEEGILPIIGEVLMRVPTRRAYLSIDKDCLRSGDALTNWEPGLMSCRELLDAVALIAQSMEIAGCDLTGDYSPCRLGGFKGLVAKMDHPRDCSASGRTVQEITATNQRTNLAILRALDAAMQR